MPDQDPEPDAPIPAEPYLSNWGPLDGPILGRDLSPALGVLGDGSALLPIGIAYPMGCVEHRRGPAQTFRLVIQGREMPGLWICARRRFVMLGDAAEML